MGAVCTGRHAVRLIDGGRPVDPRKRASDSESKSSFEKSLQRHHTATYRMKARPRGKALIISNEHFEPPMTTLVSVEIDVRALVSLLTWLEFDVACRNDLTSADMRAALQALAAEDHALFDGLVVFILTHGNSRGDTSVVLGIDVVDPLSVTECTGYFDRVTSLLGKPKLFFIEACRGHERNVGCGHSSKDSAPRRSGPSAPVEVTYGETDATNGDENRCKGGDGKNDRRVPAGSDVLVVQSTTSGHVSWGASEKGSEFIRILVSVFRQKASHTHLVDMLTMMNSVLSMRTTHAKESNEPQLQIAETKSTLRRRLFFRPGK